MSTHSCFGARPPRQPAIVPLLEGTPLFERRNAIRDQIARRAHELYLSRNGGDGSDLEDWITAEMDLLQPVPLDVTGCGESLVVRAETPGFCAEEIEVGVDPFCLVISGKKWERREGKAIFQEIDLPAEIDPSKVTARLGKGVLKITLPKAGRGLKNAA